MRVFISVPMGERSDQQILDDVQVATDALHRIFSNEDELDIRSGIMDPAPPNTGNLWYLGMSVVMLGEADAVYFCPGWKEARGCLVEHYICELYGIQRIEAD